MSAADLLEDIGRTRARLSHSLMLLDREYALRYLFLRGTRVLQETAGDPGLIGKAARENILPLSLIGIGLAWLTVGGRRQHGDVSPLLRGLAHVQDLVRDLRALAPRDPPASGNPREKSMRTDDEVL